MAYDFPQSPSTGTKATNGGAVYTFDGTKWQATGAAAQYVAKAGDTMTGALTLPGNASSNLQAVPLQQLTSVTGNYVLKAGDTMSGNLGVGYTPKSDAAWPSVFMQGGSIINNQPLFWNAYWQQPQGSSPSVRLNAGYAAAAYVNPSGDFQVLLAPSGAAGSTISAWTSTITLQQDNTLHTGNVLTDNEVRGSGGTYGGYGQAGRVGIYAIGGDSYIYLGSGNNRRLQLQSSDANFVYYRDDNQWLWQCNNAGNSDVIGRASCDNVMSRSGVFYTASDTNYYIARDSNNGNFNFVENTTRNATVQTDGWVWARSGFIANAHMAYDRYYFSNDWSAYIGGTGHRYTQYQSGWYWDWDNSNGNLWWNTYGGYSMVLRGDRTVEFVTTVSISGQIVSYNAGVRYAGGNYNTNNMFLFGWNNVVGGAVTCSVDNGGAVVWFMNASDARLKTNIEPSTFDCLGTLQQIPLHQFDWLDVSNPWDLKRARKKGKLMKNSRRDISVVAQEVAKVFPQGVVAGDDFDDHLGRVWGLNQNNMIALLVGAVQELTERVRELEQDV